MKHLIRGELPARWPDCTCYAKAVPVASVPPARGGRRGKGFAHGIRRRGASTVENDMQEGQPERIDERILVLAPRPADAALIQTVTSQAPLPARVCADVAELCRELEAGAGALLVSDEVLDPPALKRLVEALDRQPAWSGVPVVTLFGAVE